MSNDLTVLELQKMGYHDQDDYDLQNNPLSNISIGTLLAAATVNDHYMQFSKPRVISVARYDRMVRVTSGYFSFDVPMVNGVKTLNQLCPRSVEYKFMVGLIQNDGDFLNLINNGNVLIGWADGQDACNDANIIHFERKSKLENYLKVVNVRYDHFNRTSPIEVTVRDDYKIKTKLFDPNNLDVEFIELLDYINNDIGSYNRL